jgi:hypothetical protein
VAAGHALGAAIEARGRLERESASQAISSRGVSSTGALLLRARWSWNRRAASALRLICGSSTTGRPSSTG